MKLVFDNQSKKSVNRSIDWRKDSLNDFAGKICRSKKVFFHTDAAQAVGKVPVDVNEMNIDLLSISGHKIYGPKGVGALFIRRRPRVRLDPIQTGGGQERNVRSGTVPTPLVVGLGAACQIALEELQVSGGFRVSFWRISCIE